MADTRIDLPAFTAWAASAVLGNTLRGVLAEYLVARAVGDTSEVRIEWDAVDVITPSKIKIEVKPAAYIQEWKQKRPSVITFDIARKLWFDNSTGQYAQVPSRPADVYVFALFTWAENLEDKKAAHAAILDARHWQFGVLATSVIDAKLNDQRTIRLEPLRQLTGDFCDYEHLQAKIVEQAKENKRYEKHINHGWIAGTTRKRMTCCRP
jgi:hypothetical protein